MDLRHLWSLALSNIGSAHVDLGKFQEALTYFHEARRIAEEEGYLDTLALVLQGEATARIRREEFNQAQTLLQELANLKKLYGDIEGVIIALHDIGITLIKQSKGSRARKILGQALKLARKNENFEWVYRCRLNSAFSYNKNGNVEEANWALKKAAREEEKAGLYIVAARLWEAYANLLIDRDDVSDQIEKAFQRCIKCLNRVKNVYQHRLRVYKQLYIWRWESGFFESAVTLLKKIARIAAANHQTEDEIHAIDQIGVCLQNLGKFEEAEKFHRQALKLARRLKDEKCIETSLNNLGELLRKTGRLEDAVKMFIKAEAIARSRRDIESEVSIAHNRALALEDLDKVKEAEKVLRSCRDVAKRHKLWHEYVRALHGLANLAWKQGKYLLSERRYSKSLLEAERLQLSKLKYDISLNYSRLLKIQKRASEALQILKPFEKEFTKLPDSFPYHMTLANLYDEVNNLESAKVNWERARKTAIHVGNQDIADRCSAALAELRKKEHKLKLSDKELKYAFQNEDDPKSKVLILLQRIDVLLDKKKEKEIEKVFEQARTITEEHRLKKLYVDLHIRIGDYYWRKGNRSQFNAVQAFTVAMLKAVNFNIDIFFEIGKHLFDLIYEIEANERVARIDMLINRISKWLYKQIEKTEGDLIIKWVLWPLRVSRQLTTTFQDKGYLSDQEINRIIESELNSAELR